MKIKGLPVLYHVEDYHVSMRPKQNKVIGVPKTFASPAPSIRQPLANGDYLPREVILRCTTIHGGIDGHPPLGPLPRVGKKVRMGLEEIN